MLQWIRQNGDDCPCPHKDYEDYGHVREREVKCVHFDALLRGWLKVSVCKAAAATQSVAVLLLADGNGLRPFAMAVEVINVTAIPRVAGRYLDISTS
jgi:hypothetical protein